MFSWKNGSTIYPLTKKAMTVRNKEFPILKIFTSLWNKKNINKRIKKIIINIKKIIKVKDTIAFLNQFAYLKREKTSAKIIAITGSAGKTSLKNMILTGEIFGLCFRILCMEIGKEL